MNVHHKYWEQSRYLIYWIYYASENFSTKLHIKPIIEFSITQIVLKAHCAYVCVRKEFSICRYQGLRVLARALLFTIGQKRVENKFLRPQSPQKIFASVKGEIKIITYFKVFVATTRNLPRVINHERVALHHHLSCAVVFINLSSCKLRRNDKHCGEIVLSRHFPLL